MRITVKLFARLKDLAGTDELVRDVPAGATVADAWNDLVSDFPSLAPYGSSISAAVNADYARMQATLAEGDEVAFLPPVSGGQAAETRRGRPQRHRGLRS